KPAVVLRKLAELLRDDGTLVVIDYARHDDERMREHADLWLGFGDGELKKLARSAGFHNANVSSIPARFTGSGPDAHLPWQIFTSQKKKKGTHHG
ncbi:MAG: hypothetical protein ACR2HE_05460, partial [Casimicrobiaceae bacterium]